MPYEDRLSRLIRPEVLQTSAYQVQDATGLIKLDAMENPYSWPEPLREKWLDALRGIEINRYPDADAAALKQDLRDTFAIPAGMELLLGNGSDEIIQVMQLALARPGAVVLAPEPGFVMYRVVAEVAGLRYVGVPLRSTDFTLDVDAMLSAIEQHAPAVIFLAWPNNPTGNLFARDAVERIIAAAPGLVVMDEAYHAFAGETFLGTLERHDNLLVLRTLSKIGLAGLRLGFLAGHPGWIAEFDKLRLPYNISVLTQISVRFFLKHISVLYQQTERIRAARDELYRRLKEIDGIRVWPSAANFLLMRPESVPAGAVHARLKERRVLVKILDGSHPLLAGCLRVTVGTDEENAAFLDALTAIIRQ